MMLGGKGWRASWQQGCWLPLNLAEWALTWAGPCLLAKYPSSIAIFLNHLFLDTPRIRIGGVSEEYPYRIRYLIRIRWSAEVSVHSSILDRWLPQQEQQTTRLSFREIMHSKRNRDIISHKGANFVVDLVFFDLEPYCNYYTNLPLIITIILLRFVQIFCRGAQKQDS